jgi:hypothetical protein
VIDTTKSDDINVKVILELSQMSVSDEEIRLVESHFESLLMALIQQADWKRG